MVYSAALILVFFMVLTVNRFLPLSIFSVFFRGKKSESITATRLAASGVGLRCANPTYALKRGRLVSGLAAAGTACANGTGRVAPVLAGGWNGWWPTLLRLP
ncbi:hypothetical protein [Vogesella indigofera]|uniref:hypothetical protein n=1 Tax=Vogesella indigofera TaxID=45465 RepID=UPI00234F9F6B|nr:hypothetical protein [Vogesella indigofera]MDC7702309.1 hypothetical protein [Vogesella indigofera]